jgi:hypothetical protein
MAISQTAIRNAIANENTIPVSSINGDFGTLQGCRWRSGSVFVLDLQIAENNRRSALTYGFGHILQVVGLEGVIVIKKNNIPRVNEIERHISAESRPRFRAADDEGVASLEQLELLIWGNVTGRIVHDDDVKAGERLRNERP